MKLPLYLLHLTFSTILLSSCATMIHGSKQKLHIDSNPQGAEVRINKELIGTTPLDIKVSRKKTTTYEFYHPNYGSQELYVPKNEYKHKLAFVLDMLVWIGPLNPAFITDVITGALIEIDESKLSPNLADSTLFYSENVPDNNAMLAIRKEERRIRWDSLRVQQKRKTILEEQVRWTKTARKDSLLYLRETQQLTIRSTLKNEISWTISNLVSGELNFSYLRYFSKNRFATGIELGYKPAHLLSSTNHYENINFLKINGPTDAIRIMPFSNSKYLGIVSKMYLLKPNPFSMYLSLIGVYRESSYTNANITWINHKGYDYDVYNYTDSLDAQQTVIGLKLLFGISYFKMLNPKMAFCFDLYSGFGYSNVSTHRFHYNYSVYNSYSSRTTDILKNQEENTSRYTPTFHLGFKVGLRF